MKHYLYRFLSCAFLLCAAVVSSNAADGIIEIREYTLCPGDTIKMDKRQTVVFSDTILYDTIRVADPSKDSVYVYVVNVYPSFEKEEFRSIESGTTFIWRGLYITKAGRYLRRYQSQHGCDSTYILNVTELDAMPAKEVLFTLCEEESVLFNCETYLSAGTYYSDYTADSVYKITVVKIPSTVYQTTATFDGTHPYLWRLDGQKDSIITQGGVYEYRARNATTGCSDIYRLILTIDPTSYHFTESVTVCENEEFSWHNLNNLNRQGIGETTHYFDQYRTVNGKDSTYELILTVNPVPRVTRTVPFCDNIVWNGQTYTESTRLVDTLRSFVTGCDSIVTTYLSKGIHFHRHDTATITMGETLEWHGKTINVEGLYEDKYQSSFGCDSIYTLGVGMIDAAPQAKIRKYYETICEGDEITWRNKTYWQKGTYYDTTFVGGKMDSLYVLVLSVNPTINRTEHVTFTTFPVTYRSTDIPGPGIYPIHYTSILGCDSIITVMVDREVIRDVQTVTICPGEVYSWRGHIYQESYQYKEVDKDTLGNDSVEHILNLTVRYIPETRISKTICQGSSITFGDKTLSESGVYRHTFKSDGCDSTVVLSLNVINPDTVKYVHNMKEGDTFEWHDKIYTETGVDFYSYTNAAGCDSVEMLILTINHVDTIDTVAVICPNEIMTWHGITARQTGTFTGTETQSDGSIHYYRLHLTVRELQEIQKDFTICADERVNYNGKTYTKPGYYYDYLGCDTLVEIHIQQHPQQVYETRASLGGEHGYTWTYWDNGEEKTDTFEEPGTYEYESPNPETQCSELWRLILTRDETSYHFTEELTICEGDDFSWHGLNNLSHQLGISRYYDNYKTRTGQDSIYELILTVKPAVRSERTITFCGSTTWKGQTYNESAVVYDTLVSKQFGCDSIVRVNLDKATSFYQHDTATIVQGEVLRWHGIDINTDGLYRDAHLNIYGCDSIYEIGVGLVAATPQTNLYTTVWSICEGDVYTWRGKDYMTGGTYVDTVWDSGREKVDSIFALNLTVWPSNLDTIIQHLYQCEAGSYIRYNGHDYYENDTIVTTFRTIHNCDSIVKTIMHFNEALFLSDTIKIADTELPYTWKFKLSDGDRKDSVLTRAGTYIHEVAAEGGCRNHEEIVLIVHQTYLFTKDTAICQSEIPYKWTDGPKDKIDIEYSHTPGETKMYEWSYKTVDGYDSIYRLNLTIYPIYELRQQLNLCEDEVQTYNGHTYYGSRLKTDTVYRDTIRLRTLYNCDSVIYMEIMKHPVKRHTETRILHTGDTIHWNGQEITSGGIYQIPDLKQVANGCDSIEELRVIVESPDIATICVHDAPYHWRNKDYNTTGFYTDTVRDAENYITEFHTLDLTVKIPIDTIKVLRGCSPDGVTWNGITYKHDTIFRDTLLTCDTMYTVKIHVDTTYAIFITDTICEQELPYILGKQNPDTIWGPNPNHMDNKYIHTDTTACGCDSTVNLTLYIIPSLQKTDSTFVCEEFFMNGGHIWLGDTIDPWFEHREGGKYSGKWQGKWHGIPFSEDTIVYNCDSSHYHHIIKRPHQSSIPEYKYSLCKGDSVQLFWPHDTTWISKPGVYYDTVPTVSSFMDTKHNTFIHNDKAYACDSVTQWTVVYADTLHVHLYEHIRIGETYTFNDSVLSTTGVYDSIGYYQDIKNPLDPTAPGVSNMDSAHNYCKAVYTLHLSVDTIYSYGDTIEICHLANREYTYTFEDDDLSEHFNFKFQTPDKDTAILHFKDSLQQLSYGFYDHYYDLVVYYKQLYFTQIYDTICEGDSLRFDLHHRDNTLTSRYLHTKGIYDDTIPACNGCDSIIRLYLTTYDSIPTTYLERTVSDREIPYCWSHTWAKPDGKDTTYVDSLRTSGEYRYTMPSVHGCDSTIVLRFTVHETHVFSDTIDVCALASSTLAHIWPTGYEQKYTVPASDQDVHYCDTLPTRILHDSIYDLFVRYKELTITYLNADICYGDSMLFGLTRAHQPRYISKQGIYRDTLVRMHNGCDSIIELRLNVYPRFFHDSIVHIADVDTPYVWQHFNEAGTLLGKESLYTAGDYSYTFTSVLGCDSVDSLHLFIHKTYLIPDDTINICASETPYTWRGLDNITTTGDYRYGEQTLDGYDSIHTVHINVWKQAYDTVSASICEGDSMRWGLSKANTPRFVYNSGLYNDTLTTVRGCDSIIVLRLNVYPKHINRYTIDIADVDTPYVWKHFNHAGDSVGVDSLYASGLYGYKFESLHHCDSIDTLMLNIHKTYMFTEEFTICERETPYTWYDRNDITTSGTYYYNPHTADGYDSIYIATITVIPTMRGIIHEEICENDLPFRFHGKELMEGGTYIDSIASDNGCDSIVELHLTVNHPFYQFERRDIYEGEQIQFFDQTCSTSGTYTHRNTTPAGCDSVTEMMLVVHPLIDTTVVICSNELPYAWVNHWNGETTLLYRAGLYHNDTTYVNGERTFWSINLVVNEPVFDTIRAAICEGTSYPFVGMDLKEPGIYRDTTQGKNGCDSITTLILTVNQPYYSVIRETILEGHSYEFYGETYTETGTYTHFARTPGGCDSTTILQLTVHQLVDTIFTVCENDLPVVWNNRWSGTIEKFYNAGLYRNDTTMDGQKYFYGIQVNINKQVFDTIHATICEGTSYPFVGMDLKEPGIYRDTTQGKNGCDSITTLILTVQKPYYSVIRETILEGHSYEFYGETYTETGTYTHFARTPEGCDSTTILQLTVHQLVDTIFTVCENDLPVVWNNRWSGTIEKFYNAGLYRNDTTINGQKYFYGIQVNTSKQIFDTIRATICEDTSYPFMGLDLREPGIYRDTTMGTNGCDSITTLILTVIRPYYSVIRETILEGHSYEFYGEKYTTAGTYTHYARTPEGCDSTTILQLTVHQLIDTVITVCDYDLPVLWNNRWSGETEQIYNAGIYRNDTTINGKRLFYGIQVNISKQIFDTIRATICEGTSYPFIGMDIKEPGVYRDTTLGTNGCDSITTLILTVNKPYYSVIRETILAGNSVEFYGETYTKTGTYTHYARTPEGCDSTTILQLTVHPLVDTIITVCENELPLIWNNRWSGNTEQIYNAGLYRNDTTINGQKFFYGIQVNIHKQVFDTIRAAICEGTSYPFVGMDLKEPGIYRDTTQGTNGCDSITTLILTVQKPYYSVIRETILEGNSVEFYGEKYMTTGIYTHYARTPEGCDSTTILQLTVHPMTDTIFTVCENDLPVIWNNRWSGNIEKYYTAGSYRNDTTINGQKYFYGIQINVNKQVFDTIRHSMCEGTGYSFKGKTYYDGGIYRDTLRAANGCDSIVTLILTVNKPITVRIEADIYEGEQYEFMCEYYTTSGMYRHYSVTEDGCDSIVELSLHVHPLVDTVVTVCSNELPYIWVNKWSGDTTLLYHAGTYRNDTTYVNGERTFYTLQLNVNQPVQDTIKASVCEGDAYLFKGANITNAGIYRDTLRAANGCDSIVTLILTVNKPYYNVIREYILEGNSVEFFGNTYYSTGTYTHYGRTQQGCDSTTILQLSVHPLVDTVITVCDNDLPLIWNNRWSGNTEKYYNSGLYRNDTTINGQKYFYGIQINVNTQVFDTIRHSMCEGASYEFRGHTYYDAGIYRDTLRAVSGCDSIVTLILTLNKPYYNVIRETVLEGQYYVFYGDTIRETMSVSHSGRTPDGCDSTTVLELTVHQLVDTVITICSNELPYVWTNRWSGRTETFNIEGTYRNDTIINGERLYYGVQLVVHNTSSTILNYTICEGDQYNFNGQFLTTAGEYRDTLRNVAGCDSVVVLHLNVNPSYYHSVERSIYEGDTVMFQGQPYTQAGVYPFYFTTASGCDSIIELRLNVARLYDDSVTICTSDLPFIWRNKSFYESGVYRDTVTDSDGRPSVQGIKVIVLPIVRREEPIVQSICEGDFYKFGRNVLTTQGTYYDTLTAANGCDSIVTLVLQVLPVEYKSETRRIFEGDTVIWMGDTLTTSGVYERRVNNEYGCTNTYQLVLTVLKTFDVDTTAYVCENELPYIWHGYEYNESGDYTFSVAWTDSSRVVKTLHLTVNPIYYLEESINICAGDTFLFKGKEYYDNCIFYDTLPSQVGCDSIKKYILAVHPTYDRMFEKHISDKQPYNFHGRDLSQTGNYEWTGKTVHGCDSMEHLYLIVHPSFFQSDTIDLCQSDTVNYPFVWKDENGRIIATISQSGVYSDSVLTEYGFDSVHQVVVNVHPAYLIREQYEIGEGEILKIHGKNISNPAIYWDTLRTIHGCDSIFHVVVNQKRTREWTWNKEICQGEYFEFFGRKLTHTGQYKYVSEYKDSVITLNLKINPIDINESRIVITDKQVPYVHDGRIYTASGVYNDTLVNRYGCDSVLRLVLVVSSHYSEWYPMPLCPGSEIKIDGDTIREAGLYTFLRRSKVTGEMDSIYRVEVYDAPAYDFPLEQRTICQGDTLFFGSKMISRSGHYDLALKTIDGCDSLLHLDVTINPSYRFDTTVTIFDYETFTWDENHQTYNEEGAYEKTYPTILDCDSTYVLNLKVIETLRQNTEFTICEGQEYTWRGNTYTQPGYYTDTVCSRETYHSAIYSLHLTVAHPTYVTSAKAGEICADDKVFNIEFTYEGAKPTTYSIYYDQAAKDQGFKDVINKQFLGEDRYATDSVPVKPEVIYLNHTNYVKPNTYTMSLVLDNGACGISRADNIELKVKYPSWIIEQSWNDIVVPIKKELNGGYEFSQADWIVNGVRQPNNGKGYLKYNFRDGDEVVLIATRKGENKAIESCPIIIGYNPNLAYDEPILVYPTQTPRYAPRVTVEAPLAGKYEVYASTGLLVDHGSLDEGVNQLSLPAISGVYFLRIYQDNDVTSYKVMVY